MAFNSLILRLELVHAKVNFGEVASTISRAGGDITSIDVIRPGQDSSVRDITVHVAEIAETSLIESLKSLAGIQLINVSDRTFLAHLGVKYQSNPICRSKIGMIYLGYIRQGWPASVRPFMKIRKSVLADYQTKHCCGCNRWYRCAGAWRYRSACGCARDGRQSDAVQATRRSRRLSYLSGYEGYRGNHPYH